MADNSSLPVASGNETFANDDIGGVKYPRQKVTWGPDGTANDADSAVGKQLPVGIGTVTLLNARVAPTNSAATLIAARTGRQRVTFKNVGAVSVWIGIATVTVANGMQIDPGESITLNTAALVQAITSAGTGDVAIIEEY